MDVPVSRQKRMSAPAASGAPAAASGAPSYESTVLKEMAALTTCSMSDFKVMEVKGVGQNGMVLSMSVRKPGFPFPPTYRVAMKVFVVLCVHIL